MNMKVNTEEYAKAVEREARLDILRFLSELDHGSASVEELTVALDDNGHRHRPKDEQYVEQQVLHLKLIRGVDVFEERGVVVARIRKEGLAHVAGRSVLVGVKKPFG